MPERPGVSEHEHSVRMVEMHAAPSEKPVHVAPDAAAEPGPVEVVGSVEASQPANRPGQRGQPVDVDQPLELVVGEPVPQRRTAGVAHRPDDERGQRRSEDPRHHVTPNDSAASTPERQPSSWKPQPRWAPAKARRSPPAPRSRVAAATASWVKTGWA